MDKKPGPKPDPKKKDYKQWTIRCSREQIEYIRRWLKNGGIVKKK